jgi:hypothetical protein
VLKLWGVPDFASSIEFHGVSFLLPMIIYRIECSELQALFYRVFSSA